MICCSSHQDAAASLAQSEKLKTLRLIEQRDAGSYKLREHITTRVGARTSFFSTELNELYLAVPARGKQAAELRVFQPQQ